MKLTLNLIPRQATADAISALASLSYPELVRTHGHLSAQDPTIIFDTLRPIGDEIWNLINGQRDLGAIAEALCFQFDLDVEPDSFFPLIEGLERDGLVTLEKPLTSDGE